MNNRSVYVWLALLFACSTGPRQPLEFKGHKVGDRPWLPSRVGEPNDSTLRTCMDPADSLVGDIRVQVTYEFRNNQLKTIRMYFPAEKFYEITAALESKFGPGDEKKEKSQLTDGDVTTAIFWVDDRTSLYVTFLRGLDQALLSMRDRNDMSDLREAEAAVERAKQGI